jgi:hypothetical protein
MAMTQSAVHGDPARPGPAQAAAAGPAVTVLAAGPDPGCLEAPVPAVAR